MPADALPSNQEDREVYLREVGAGDFVSAMKQREKSGDVLVQTLSPSWDSDTIYVVVEYAREIGLAVSLVIQEWEEGREAVLDQILRGRLKPGE